jgi:tRNA A37 threonylcarbamoyladenosine modification protein TsaB
LLNLPVIQFPVLAFDTSDAAVARCAWFQDQFGVGDVIEVKDAATNLVHEAQRLCQGRRPTSVAWVHGPGSYTGLRIGWCIVRTINFAWGCPVWSMKKSLVFKEEEILNYNLIGGPYYN